MKVRDIEKCSIIYATIITLDRCTEIEKANRILLEKMTNIMTHTQNQGNHTASQAKRLTTAGNSTN